jgi:hypothetical protein
MARPGRWIVGFAVAAVLVGAGSWMLVRWVINRSPAVTAAVGGSVSTPAGSGERRIKATLYYVAEDGMRLVPVERDVVFAEGVSAQARRILEAQIQQPPPPLLPVIPAETTLRGLYVADKGEAYVDLGGAIRTGHPGGSLNELFTVYSIVSVLTVNLPAITSVQILVDGHEVDTLAGHIDLRRPLPRSSQWLEPPPVAAAR